MDQLWDREPPLSKPVRLSGETLVVIRSEGQHKTGPYLPIQMVFPIEAVDVVEIESKKGRMQWIDAGF